jgi:hypothetical protein
MKRAIWMILASAAVTGCTSPEATRQRGGGPGGDPNNRPALVKMHEGSQQYYETPVLIPAEGPPLAPSEQARYLSLPSTDTMQTPAVGREQDR